MNWTAIIAALKAFIAAFTPNPPTMPQDNPAPQIPPPAPAPVPAPPMPSQPYLWDTPSNVRHSIRVIADEEGLTFEQKNTLCKVLACESGFHTKAVHPNLDKNGHLASTDYGVAQWNDYWHAKEISPQEALNNPEKAIRLMCKYVKAGQLKQWVCYSSNLYLKYPA